jgi:enoyl-CoA hydratase/carnithine racemase
VNASYTSTIGHLVLSPSEFNSLRRSPYADEFAGDDPLSLVLVRGDGDLEPAGSLPVVVCAIGGGFGGVGPRHADLVVGTDDVDDIITQVARSPLAAATLAVLLRSLERAEVDAGLAQESAAYSVLQAGPEFAAWRAGARHEPHPDDRPVVSLERRDNEVIVTLDRPHRHNAITAQTRDELAEALALVAIDGSVRSLVLRGSGPSFCSGGDLGEFGRRPDPATAHRARLARSPARLLHRLRRRTTALVHGSTLGGGIEMAAFAGRVVAEESTVIGLPEIELGLIPGAGGTVSLTRRIGRQRTAALALTGRRIDARMARAWGLVDQVVGHHDHTAPPAPGAGRDR